MEFAFYLSAIVALAATLRVVMHTNPVHALLYLIVSLLAVSGVFFSFGAYFAGALEIIVYAGAIMVLFVFVVMMLNLGNVVIEQEKAWLKPGVWIGPSILCFVLLIAVVSGIWGGGSNVTVHEAVITGHVVTPKDVGMSLFGPYLLLVQLAVMLLLGGLVAAYHLGREHRFDADKSSRLQNSADASQPRREA